MNARLLAAALTALLLAGCGGHKDKADQRTASGQVLQGTISDDMLPLATVTSQPPRMKARPSTPGGENAGDQQDEDVDAGDQATGDSPPTAGDTGEGD